MEVSSLKQHILDEDLVEQILEAIGCHHIKKHGKDYISAGNKDGDNTSRNHNAWYKEQSNFVQSSSPWFLRGQAYSYGILAGQFGFQTTGGTANGNNSYRIVLS